MSLPADAEARFKKIEDTILVIVEMQRRAEARTQEDIDRLKWIQDALAKWTDTLATRQEESEFMIKALYEAQARDEISVQNMRQALADLAATVELYLKARSNGNN